MMQGDWFVLVVIIIQFCACVSYAIQSQWAQSLVWLGVAAANCGVLWLSMK